MAEAGFTSSEFHVFSASAQFRDVIAPQLTPGDRGRTSAMHRRDTQRGNGLRAVETLTAGMIRVNELWPMSAVSRVVTVADCPRDVDSRWNSFPVKSRTGRES